MSQVLSRNVSASFQAASFLVSCCILFSYYYAMFDRFIIHDPVVQVKECSGDKGVIQTGFHITGASAFDITKNQFVLGGVLWFLYDARIVSADTIDKFEVPHGTILKKSAPIIRRSGTDEMVQYDVRILFDLTMNFRLFPIDDHIVSLMFTNYFLPEGICFQSSERNVTYENNMVIPGWYIRNHQVRTGKETVDLVDQDAQFSVSHDVVVLSLGCERMDPSIIFNILISLILILLVSLFNFSSNEDSVLIVSVALVALVGYRAVMQSLAPQNVTYFMLSDYLYIITMISVVLSLLLGIFVRDRLLTIREKNMAVIFIYIFFMGSCVLMPIIL